MIYSQTLGETYICFYFHFTVLQIIVLIIFVNASVKPSNSLAHVVAKLAVVKMHRVFVANPKEGLKPLGVVSISDLLRHIFNMGVVTTTKGPALRTDGSPSLRPKGSDIVKGMKSMKPLS